MAGLGRSRSVTVMSERTSAPGQVAEGARGPRRRAGSGHQQVGDYVGQVAGEAAKAVRRAGLRPGLDRQFGCAAQLTGLVVAQDPAAGSDLARNGMVTLYVAAPASDPAEENTAATDHTGQQANTDPVPALAERPVGEVPAARRPRRRKQGLASRAGVSDQLQMVPAPVRAVPDSEAGDPIAVRAPGLPTDTARDFDGEPAVREGLADEELVVRAEDILAGRSGRLRWRGGYRRPGGPGQAPASGGRVRGWLSEHRLLAGLVTVAVVLWMVLGIASVLQGSNSRTPARAIAASPTQTARRHTRRQSSPAGQALSGRESSGGWVRRKRSRPAARELSPSPGRVVQVVGAGRAAGSWKPLPVAPPAQPAVPQGSAGGLFSP